MAELTERFANAVKTLVSDGPVKQRLARAFAEHLGDLTPSELPAGAREPFNELCAALNRVEPAGTESRVRASVQKMSPTEAGGHAGKIVDLYVELLGQAQRAEPLKVVSPGPKPPRYLTQRS